MKHILMVDDVTTNLKCAMSVLHDSYKISMVKSGVQALKFLEKSIPDLILLDICMPEMDGYETFERILANPEWKEIPVIFLTAEVDAESEVRGLNMGAMDYICKPFDAEVVKSRIDKILQNDESLKKLEVFAKKDALTGLWNRRFLEEKLEEISESEIKNPGSANGVFMLMDLDNFKGVNDNFGHLVGDAILVTFAKALSAYCTENDLFCRIGGDEFVLYMKGRRDLDEIRKLASIINTEVSDTVNKAKDPGHDVSVSVGISLLPDNGIDFLTLYNKADKALYHIKENGKKGYHFYMEKDGTSDHNIGSDHSTAADLNQVRSLLSEKDLSNGAFQVEYDGFKRIFQFLSRGIKRSKQKVQIVLVTMEEKPLVSQEVDSLINAVQEMHQIIMNSLRKGDVATQYSSTQFIVLLMDTDTENGSMVAERFVKKFNDEAVNARFVNVKLDVEQVDTTNLDKE